MYVNPINSSYSTSFQGVLKIKNLKNGNNVIEKQTTIEVDRGLANAVLKNIFDGNWANEGYRNISENKLAQYQQVLNLTLGINIPRTTEKFEQLELKNLGTGYNIKSEGKYEITHLRDDLFWC